jgi:hypothetical protein
MTDYGQELRFGLFPSSAAAGVGRIPAVEG